jgi:L-fuculose-phosphate aldolase
MTIFLEKRRAVIDTCLRLAERGFLAGVGGNLAARIDEHTFAVTPSAADYYSLRPSDICVLALHDLRVIDGHRQPSVESGLHAQLLLKRRDASASIHTHQPLASAVALLAQPIPLHDPELRAALGPRVELVSYAPSGTSLLVHNFKKRLNAGINAYLLRSHGLICSGRSLDDGARNVELVERAAANHLREAIQARRSQLHPLINRLAAGALGA